jgi:hypothetical protein
MKLRRLDDPWQPLRSRERPAPSHPGSSRPEPARTRCRALLLQSSRPLRNRHYCPRTSDANVRQHLYRWPCWRNCRGCGALWRRNVDPLAVPRGRSLSLTRSYLILSMQIRAATCRNVVRDMTTFWLHDLGRSGERAVRTRSLVIKELPEATLPLVVLATPFGPFAKSSQATSHLQPTRRRNLGLTAAADARRRWGGERPRGPGSRTGRDVRSGRRHKGAPEGQAPPAGYGDAVNSRARGAVRAGQHRLSPGHGR